MDCHCDALRRVTFFLWSGGGVRKKKKALLKVNIVHWIDLAISMLSDTCHRTTHPLLEWSSRWFYDRFQMVFFLKSELVLKYKTHFVKSMLWTYVELVICAGTTFLFFGILINSLFSSGQSLLDTLPNNYIPQNCLPCWPPNAQPVLDRLIKNVMHLINIYFST